MLLSTGFFFNAQETNRMNRMEKVLALRTKKLAEKIIGVVFSISSSSYYLLLIIIFFIIFYYYFFNNNNNNDILLLIIMNKINTSLFEIIII